MAAGYTQMPQNLWDAFGSGGQSPTYPGGNQPGMMYANGMGEPVGLPAGWGAGLPSGGVQPIAPGFGQTTNPASPTNTPPAQPGMAPGNSSVDQLYANWGKPGGLGGGLVDQQGYDYWNQRAGTGEDITQAFNNSASTVYGNMLAGQPSPYQSQNMAGFNNLQTGNTGASTPAPTGPGSDGQYQGYYAMPGGAASTGGMAALPSLTAYSQNPNLTAMGNGLRDQFTGFMNDGLASNRGESVAAGGVGGSRQGIAEARTMTDAGKGFDSALATLNGQDYQAQMERNLRQYQGDQTFNTAQAGLGLTAQGQANNYDLGRRGVDLGYLNANNNYDLGRGQQALTGRGQDQSFYTAQRGQDQSGAALGASLYNQGTQGQWSPVQNASGVYSPYTGYGTTTTSGASGGGAAGTVGGLLSGASYARQMGWI